MRLAVTTAAVAFALAACGGRDQDALARARQLKDHGEFLKAQALLTRIIDGTSEAADPQSVAALRRDALLDRAVVFRNRQELSAAITDYRTVAETVDPGNVLALNGLAAVLAQRGDPKSLDEAIVYAERSLAEQPDAPHNAHLHSAPGVAYYKRGRDRRDKVIQDIRVSASATDVPELERSLRAAVSLPPDDPRSIAFMRELEVSLDFRNADLRDRVLGGINAAREDYQRAAQHLRKALKGVIDADALGILIECLTDRQDLDEPLLLTRVAMRHGYQSMSGFVGAAAGTFAASGLYREAASIREDFLKRFPTAVFITEKLLLLQHAAASKDPEFLESAIATVRKTLGRGQEAQLGPIFLGYFQARLQALRGAKPEELVPLLEPVTRRPVDVLYPILPDAAFRLATALRALKRPQEARAACEAGFQADPSDLDLVGLHGILRLETGDDPLLAANDIALAFFAAPTKSEHLLPSLRDAANAYLRKVGQSLESLEQDALARGAASLAGVNEGWIFYVASRDYLAQGQWAAAAACSLEALSRDVGLTPALVVTGLARAALGEMQEARDAFARATKVIPNDPTVCRRILESGAAPPDIRLRLVVLRPETEGRTVVAESLYALGRVEDAERVLRPLAASPDVPDRARLLEARLLATRDGVGMESFLSGIPADTAAAVTADEIRAMAAMQRGDTETAAAVALRLRAARFPIDAKGLGVAVARARAAGRAVAAVPIARLVAERATEDRKARGAALASLAQTLEAAGDPKAATEVLDRLVGLERDSGMAIQLALALHDRGDNPGMADALAIARDDWGAARIDFRRASLALLAGALPRPDEAIAVAPSIDDPISVAVTAAVHVLVKSRPPTDAEIPPATPWIRSAVEFAGKTSERASRVLRLCILLRTPGCALIALQELGKLGDPQPFGHVVEVEAYAALGDLPRAMEACEQAARAFPDMEVDFGSALSLALETGDDAAADRIAATWAEARKKNPRAVLEAELRERRRKIARREDLEAVEVQLVAVRSLLPDDFETALVLLEARRALGKRAPLFETVRQVQKLAGTDEKRWKRAVEPVMSAYSDALKPMLKDAREAAEAFHAKLPGAAAPVRLLAACDLAQDDPDGAAKTVLAYLRDGNLLSTLRSDEIDSFVSLLAPVHPVAAVEIARLSTAGAPGDSARWESLARRLDAVGRREEATELLDAYCRADPLAPARLQLAEFLAAPGGSAARAIAILDELAAGVASRTSSAPDSMASRPSSATVDATASASMPASLPASSPGVATGSRPEEGAASRPSDERASRPSDERASRPASAPAIDLATEIVLARAHAYTTQDRGDQALAALRPLLAGRGVAVEPWLAKAAAYAYATRGQYGDLQRATAYLVQSADQLPPAKAVAAKLLGGMFFFFHQSTPAPKAPGT